MPTKQLPLGDHPYKMSIHICKRFLSVRQINKSAKKNPEEGVIVKFHRFIVKKKFFEKGGVVPSGSESRSLLLSIHDTLKDVNEHQDFELGLEEIRALLELSWVDLEERKRAEQIKSPLELPLEPKQKLYVIDDNLDVYFKYPRVLSHK